jgi:branched-chain amino acid transport system substrate-binding protein
MADQSRARMSRRKFVQGAAAAGVGGLVLGGLAGYGAARVASESGGTGGSIFGPIKIGAALPLTGWAAADGQEMKRGLEMAVEEAKARGDVGGDITLSILDVENMGPEIVTNAFRRLIDQEKVDAIIIGYVVGTGPEYDIVAEAGVPYMHVNTYEATARLVRENPDKYWMIFQGDPTEVWYGTGLPKFVQGLIDSGKWEPANNKAVVITSDNPYSITIAELFIEGAKQLGWDVPVYEQVVTPVADWGPVIAKIRQTQPALIVNTDFTPSDLATFTKEIVADPPPALLYEQYGPSIPEFLELAGDAANGVIWSTVIGVLPDQMANDWRQRYQQKFGEPPGFSNAGSEYDMVNIYLRAVAMAGGPKDRRKVCQYIKNMIHRGVCGTYIFNTPDNTVPPYPVAVKDPSLGMPHLYFQIQDGQHRVIWPDPYVEAEFQLPPWLKS